MSDVPKKFTAEYYEEEYFVGTKGGKKFRRPNGELPDKSSSPGSECKDKILSKSILQIKEALKGSKRMSGLPKYEYEGPDVEETKRLWLYCGPYKEVHLSCGHSFRCEFSQYRKGQKTYCPKCGRDVEVVKIVDTVTGKEYDCL